MLERFSCLRRKEVVNVCDGCRLGYVGDLEIKYPEGEIKAIVVFGPCRFFGLFGRGEDYYIPWECVLKPGREKIKRRFYGRIPKNSLQYTFACGIIFQHSAQPRTFGRCPQGLAGGRKGLEVKTKNQRSNEQTWQIRTLYP